MKGSALLRVHFRGGKDQPSRPAECRSAAAGAARPRLLPCEHLLRQAGGRLGGLLHPGAGHTQPLFVGGLAVQVGHTPQRSGQRALHRHPAAVPAKRGADAHAGKLW